VNFTSASRNTLPQDTGELVSFSASVFAAMQSDEMKRRPQPFRLRTTFRFVRQLE
jgi:hypothetical protein